MCSMYLSEWTRLYVGRSVGKMFLFSVFTLCIFIIYDWSQIFDLFRPSLKDTVRENIKNIADHSASFFSFFSYAFCVFSLMVSPAFILAHYLGNTKCFKLWLKWIIQTVLSCLDTSIKIPLSQLFSTPSAICDS